ncbi:MAG: FadR family transcriptional regulator [Lachnospiraceae bacterium]|nr:FadR family transcriptional regulator [Lachnospiraceae bacterium]
MSGAATLTEQVLDKMVDYIKENNLQPGDRLGTEMEMAKRMGVSRGTVREAIKILVFRNMLEVRQGSGTYVSDGKTPLAGDPLGLELIPDQFKLTWDLHEMRMLLEPEIAYRAATNIAEGQLDRLREMCDEMERLSEQRKERMPLDVEFHICLAESSGNLVVPKLIPVLRQGVELFIKYTHREATPESVAKHRDILEALEARDPQWAKDMMLMHLTYNSQEIRREAVRRGVMYDL